MKNYTDLAPALPWVIAQGSPSTIGQLYSTPGLTTAVGDVDGDSRSEVVVVNPVNPGLTLVSYFEYADVTAGWAAYREPQLVNCFAQPVIGGPKQNAPTWNVSTGDVVWCADVDADGRDEILIFNPDDQWVGLLKWNGAGLECVWLADGEIPGLSGGSTWYVGGSDQHFVADLDGDGRDEILVFNPDDQWVGVLCWDGSGMGCVWSAGGQIKGGPAGDWVIGSADQHFAADFDGDGKDEIFIFDPEDQWVGVFGLDGSALQCVWMVGGKIPNGDGTDSYPINGADQYHVADFNGDGRDELFVFNPDENWISAFNWSGSALQWLGGQEGGVPASHGGSGWNFGGADRHFVADLDGDGADEIVVFDRADQYVGVFEWNGYSMECPWLVGGQIQDAAGGGGWNIGETDQYLVAGLKGDGRDQLVVVNQTDQWAGTLRWDGSQLQNTWAAPGYFPYWGVSLLAGGPETPFPYSQQPFVDTQMAIYQYVSGKLASTDDIRSLYPTWGVSDFAGMQQALDKSGNPDYEASEWAAVVLALSQDFVYGYISDTLDSGCQGDIRFEYTNDDKADSDFGQYVTQAQGLAAAAPPQPFDFDSADPYGRYQLFPDVALQIAGECSCIGDVRKLLDDQMYKLAGLLKDAQEGQLDGVVVNITKTVSPAVSAAGWWVGQVADALLWGEAACSFGEGMYGVNIGLSITASLFGTILSAGSGDSGDTPPPPLTDLLNMEAQLEQTYESALKANANALTVILQDPVKLPLIYGLVQKVWAWPVDALTGVVNQSAENSYRLNFYQQLIPLSFQMMVWSDSAQSQPYYIVSALGNPATQYIDAPDYSYQSVELSDGRYNIYLLYQGPSLPSQSSMFQYPSNDMMTDLFQNLGVSPADFFTGADGWNIPTVAADPNS